VESCSKKRHTKIKILKSTWAFKIKRLPSGKLRKFKARLCVHGDLQTFGVNYWETYARVVSWTTVRLITVLALVHDLHSKQVDYVNAYCQAPLKDHEELYMEPPRGYKLNCEVPCVLKLLMSLYGLRQAGSNWFLYLKDSLMRRGFRQSALDPCFFIRNM